MKTLLISDLHLTSSPKDEYRWALFPWLKEAIIKNEVKNLLILGDLTESKDYHSAKLVNRIVDELAKLYREANLFFIYIVRGNHDGNDPNCPYFRFLRQFAFIKYIETPYMEEFRERKTLFLPHSRDPLADWDTKMLYDAEVIFMHATVAGALSENGQSLEGMSAQALTGAKRATIWSGDVHVPQKVGAVEYVGAPYPIRFGDAFKPRAVLLDMSLRKPQDLEPPYFSRNMIVLTPDENDRLEIFETKGQRGPPFENQVKVRVRLNKAQYVNWEKYKREVLDICKNAGCELHGLEVERVEEAKKTIRIRGAAPESVKAAPSPSSILSAWCQANNVPEPIHKVGQKLLAEAK